MRRGVLRALVGAAAVAAAFWSLWPALPRAVAAPTLDDQVHAIAGVLMCPVCGGQTVSESGSPLAEQMRAIIRERLRAGQTRDEIIAYFVDQFGEGVLAAPPPRGSGLAVWLVPPAALGIGLVVLLRFVRRTHSHAGQPGHPPTPAEVERIRRDLRELD